ncbi:MAG: YkgJ family cysteine cluster protein [Desulfovibrio sp.]|jgi:Fe-S-cluster containining protein|nr:YkgJ family cysteine cluster protein [Desulfovibrio sp.]
MIPDLSAVFEAYEQLQEGADALFARVRESNPDCVRCREGCSDCCHAIFDLSLVEAMYINRAFLAAFDHGPQRSSITARAARTDRDLTRFKRNMYRAERNGEEPAAIMTRAAGLKIPCPLLDEGNRCLLYAARPITCRIYGVPAAIAGQTHACGFSGFERGKPYPTVYLDKIQSRLDAMSRDIKTAVNSRFSALHEVYVPLSMALLTNYDATYLGAGPAKREG